MTVTRLAGILAAGGLVFVGTLFFFDSQTRNLEAHVRTMDAGLGTAPAKSGGPRGAFGPHRGR
jgi:hypothetical protein